MFAGATGTFVVPLFGHDGNKNTNTTGGGHRSVDNKRRHLRAVAEVDDTGWGGNVSIKYIVQNLMNILYLIIYFIA